MLAVSYQRVARYIHGLIVGVGQVQTPLAPRLVQCLLYRLVLESGLHHGVLVQLEPVAQRVYSVDADERRPADAGHLHQ